MSLARRPHEPGAFSTIRPGKRLRWTPDPEDVVALAIAKSKVWSRCNGLCEGCGRRIPLIEQFDLAHRVSRRVKVWRYDVRNLLALHRRCHQRAGSGSQAARDAGLWLRTTDDPTEEPMVLYAFGTGRTRKVKLTADGGYEDVT